VAEVLALPLNKGSYGIRSLKIIAQILRLGQRIRLKSSGSLEMTSSQFPTIDESITNSNPDAVEPVRTLKDKTELAD